jgi:hypothetical protein
MVVLSEKSDAHAYWDMVNKFSGKKYIQEPAPIDASPGKTISAENYVQPEPASSCLTESLMIKLAIWLHKEAD